MKYLKIVIIGSSVALILLVMAFFVISKADQSRGDLQKLYQLPDFTFTERDGEPFGLADMTGKVSIVDFIFTNCPGPCPMMSSKMAELYETYAGSGKVQFVSISVDPARDTLDALREYALGYGVSDNRWVFLRAPIDSVIKLYESGFKLGGLLPAEHSTKFILVDEEGVIRGYYSSDDDISLNIMKTHIRELVLRLQ
ncbi:MAG: SCO family protein [Calditrichaceae bacterium]